MLNEIKWYLDPKEESMYDTFNKVLVFHAVYAFLFGAFGPMIGDMEHWLLNILVTGFRWAGIAFEIYAAIIYLLTLMKAVLSDLQTKGFPRMVHRITFKLITCFFLFIVAERIGVHAWEGLIFILLAALFFGAMGYTTIFVTSGGFLIGTSLFGFTSAYAALVAGVMPLILLAGILSPVFEAIFSFF